MSDTPVETTLSEPPNSLPQAQPSHPVHQLSKSVPADATEGTRSAPNSTGYVKLAMRNMVRKKGISIKHFFLTTAGVLALLVGLSYLTR